ncbi:MAG: hypothetical protein JWO38_7310 [Gemmataceae bacterium]|nr:hypothetical protein [Gemmataceae bacterium]
MTFRSHFPVAAALVLVAPLGQRAGADDAGRAAEQFFERKVRPVLVEHCQKCHGPEKQKGGLRVDSRKALLTGGDLGPAVVPGDVEKSLLVKAVCWADEALRMPPAKKLADAVIADLKTWVKAGAPWPGPAAGGTATQPKGPRPITDEDRKHWAFQPVKRPALPAIADTSWAASPIDNLVAAKLQAKSLRPNPPAAPRELIRRAYFDLIGLPPTPEEVAAFEADPSPTAFAAVVDRLLARPQFGERWGRHWLDVVRFAQTNGYEYDQEKPLAWKYRDYVIKSFNADKPYDRFVLEQLAGDELPDATDDTLIATGFYRLGVWDSEPDDGRAAEFENLDDVLVTTGASFLGLTVGCARCHDHKLDPIPHEDYYQLLAFIRNVRTYNGSRQEPEAGGFVPLGDRAAIDKKLSTIAAGVKPLREQLAKAKDGAERRRLETEIDRIINDGVAGLEWALAVRDGAPKQTQVLLRGNPGTPGAEVQPGFPRVLGAPPPVITPPAHGRSSGRRLALAKWIASPTHPLTARVMANRIWQHLFGRGIVKTTADFGKGGTPPTHPELLDFLAADFTGHGWSVKHLIRTVMLSRAYQMSSRADNSQAAAADPGNDLFWRQNLRRLEAEAIRDSVLAVSGTLNPQPGGRGFYPRLAGEVLAGGSRPGDGWGISAGDELNRRSVYAYLKRSVIPPMFDGFDYANVNAPLTERQVTTVAPQALLLLNDAFLRDQADAFAGRVRREAGSNPAKQVDRAYQLALGRVPTAREREVARAYLDRQAAAFTALADRLTFAPDVPGALHVGYLNKLAPVEMLLGPKAGWAYYRGAWSGGYEGIMNVDRARTPFALWAGPAFADGTVTARVTLSTGAELAGVLVRGSAAGTDPRGYEVVIDARDRAVSLVKHGAKPEVLARKPFDPPANKPIPLRVAVDGSRVRVWLDESPLLDVTDREPVTAPGRLGVRAWGGAVSLDGLTVTAGGRTLDVATTPADSAAAAMAGLPEGWVGVGGTWAVADGAVLAEPGQGSKAAWAAGPAVADGVVEADVMLRSPGGDAGLLIRAAALKDGPDELRAYNVNFHAGAIRLGRHDNNWRELKAVPFEVGVNKWHRVRVELTGGRVRITVDGAKDPQIDYTDPDPLPAGKLGLRSFGSKFAVRGLRASADGKTVTADLKPAKPAAPKAVTGDSPQDKALAALCLVLLNVNEFVYVD